MSIFGNTYLTVQKQSVLGCRYELTQNESKNIMYVIWQKQDFTMCNVCLLSVQTFENGNSAIFNNKKNFALRQKDIKSTVMC